jgi:hypothetical protein
LNTAAYRYLRGFRGLDNLFSVGEATGDRRQINGRVDHNFNQNHKGNFNFSYERVSSDDVLAALPGTWSNENFHRPIVTNAGFVSTLSASLVNEAKFGFRQTGTNVVAPWDREVNQESINKYLPAEVNGFRILPDITATLGLCSPITGARPPGNCAPAPGNLGGGAITATATDKSPLWTYGDTLSWTKGKHAFKMGAEIRRQASLALEAGGATLPTTIPVATGGAAPNAAISTAAISGTSIPGLAGTATSGNNATMRNLLNFLSGSIARITEFFAPRARNPQI